MNAVDRDPTPRVTGYHAHVYFEGAEQRRAALALREAVASRFPSARLGRVQLQPVAFHPLPMFQIAFAPDRFAALVGWLMLNRGALRVMVHPLHGDVWREHLEHAAWLGEPLALDRQRLARLSA